MDGIRFGMVRDMTDINHLLELTNWWQGGLQQETLQVHHNLLDVSCPSGLLVYQHQTATTLTLQNICELVKVDVLSQKRETWLQSCECAD